MKLNASSEADTSQSAAGKGRKWPFSSNLVLTGSYCMALTQVTLRTIKLLYEMEFLIVVEAAAGSQHIRD